MLPPSGLDRILDLNHIYQQYSVSLHMAENAVGVNERAAHQRLADGYAAQIADAKIHGSGLALQ